jgi:lysophospholipase L1-like esterase
VAATPDGIDTATTRRWVGTWACAPQLAEPDNNPPAPGLAHNTLRQIVCTSIGGERLRLRLSNEFGDGPVTMRAVHAAPSTAGDGIDASRDTFLTFGNNLSVTIRAAEAAFSDPFSLPLAPHSKLAVSIHFGAAPIGITGHPGSRTTSFLAPGDAVSAAKLGGVARIEHWYYIAGLDVLADAANAAVVALGDSLTDGRGSTTDRNDRWTDILSRRLRADAPTANVAVLNQGIGGNAVLRGGLGPPAIQRLSRDVLEQRGVRWLILFEGVNDIGNATTSAVAQDLVAAYATLIDKARARHIRVFGATLTPFAGSQYDTADHEAARQTVNAWIRNSGAFDAVLDFDAAVRDPRDARRLAPSYDTGDHLHLSPAGYRRIGEAIDLSLFG